MKFYLFSKISFEIPDPITLIECYCYQNDFYAKYDLLLEHRGRKIEDVNKIGARIEKGGNRGTVLCLTIPYYR